MCLTYLDFEPKLVNGCAHCSGLPPSGVTKGFAGALTPAKPAKRWAERAGFEPAWGVPSRGLPPPNPKSGALSRSANAPMKQKPRKATSLAGVFL